MIEVVEWTMVVLALLTVLQRRPIHSVITRMALSVLAILAYYLLMAPDVALAEAMLGGLLTTFIYVSMLRNPVKIRVGYVPVRIIFEEHPWGMDGIAAEIVRRFARSMGYDLEYVRFESVEDLLESLESGYVDIACGPVVDRGFPILRTKIFRDEDGKEVDFLSMKGPGEFVRDASYTIPSNLKDFEDFLSELEERGELDEIVEKYAG